MADGLFLERLLEEKAGEPACRGCAFWHSYMTMRDYLADQYYPWIQACCPWFTDHGDRHVESVIHTAGQLLSGQELNCVELYLLLNSIIWHDVGMVAERANHAQRTEEFIAKVRGLCLANPALFRLVSQIARAHSGNEGWSFLLQEEPIDPCTHSSWIVYPRSLAALLRFADAASETRNRISPALMHQVPMPHRVFWEYASSITASKPEPARRRLLLAIELERSAATARYPCPAKFTTRADDRGHISLIEYVVCSLEYMNNERVYCYPYLNRYADIMTIEVRLQLRDGTDGKLFDRIVLGDGGLSSSEYPRIALFDRFFEAFPELTPKTLEGGA